MNGLHRAPLSSVRAANSACPSQISNTETIISQEVTLFTVESDRMFVVVVEGCVLNTQNFEATIRAINLDGDSQQIFVPLPIAAELIGLASYTQRPIFVDTDATFGGLNIGTIASSNRVLVCGGSTNGNPVETSQRGLLPNVIRSFRESQQQLPGENLHSRQCTVLTSSPGCMRTYMMMYHCY